MLGTGLIGRFYTESLHGKRSRDRVQLVYSRSEDKARKFAEEYGIGVTDEQLAVRIVAIQYLIDVALQHRGLIFAVGSKNSADR